MRVALVVFDMAGTTVDDPGVVNLCFREALASAGLDLDASTINDVMGFPKPEAIRILIERSAQADTLRGQVDAIHRDFVHRMLRFYATDPSVQEVAGARRTFEDLKRAGIKVALDTGFSRDIAQVILDRLGWVRDGLVDATITSDEVPRGRPHPDMIHQLMQQLGVHDPRTVVKVGDAPADLQEGTNAGCGWVVGVTQGTHTREQLEPYPYTHLIPTVAELPALLGLR